MLLLGIDPGKQGAVSAWTGDRFLWVKRVDNTKEDVIGVLQWAKREAPGHGGLSITIERQFQGRGAKLNPATAEVLMHSRFLWEILADVLEIEATLVWPSTWQSKQLAPAPAKTEKGHKMTTKMKSIWVANHYIAKRDWTDGESDAALIGRWYARIKAAENF